MGGEKMKTITAILIALYAIPCLAGEEETEPPFEAIAPTVEPRLTYRERREILREERAAYLEEKREAYRARQAKREEYWAERRKKYKVHDRYSVARKIHNESYRRWERERYRVFNPVPGDTCR